MKIIQDIKNNLLKRREIKLVMNADSNPGFEGAKKAVLSQIKTPEENIAIKFVKNNFGTKEFLIEVFVYDSVEDKMRIEQKPKVKKKAGEGAQ